MDIFTATETAYKNGYAKGYEDAINSIGEWKITPISTTIYCSLCDHIPIIQKETAYCPNCKARMLKGEW